MEFKIKINCENSAFEGNPWPEIRRILNELDDKILSGHDDGVVKDINGNTVGRWGLDRA